MAARYWEHTTPPGVSAWIATGKKWGYYAYFEAAIRKRAFLEAVSACQSTEKGSADIIAAAAARAECREAIHNLI